MQSIFCNLKVVINLLRDVIYYYFCLTNRKLKLFTLTLVDTRSAILVIVMALGRLYSAVDFCEDKRFLLLFVSPTSFNIFPFLENWCYSACHCCL